MRIENEVVIDVPIEGAFLFVEDVQSYDQWSRSLARSEIAIDRPIQNGSALSIAVGRSNRHDVFAGSVTQYDPPQAFSFEISDNKNASITVDWALADMDGRTRVTVTAEVDMLTWYLRLIDKLFLSSQMKPDVIDLKKLKAFAEKMWRQEAKAKS